MKIKIVQGINCDNAEHEEMYIDGKRVESAYPLNECPEDAYLERDMISCSDIVYYMQKAYNAGETREEFIVSFVEEDDDE